MQNDTNLKKLLQEGAKEFSITLDELQVDQLLRYKDILKEWNEKINLTAIEEDMDIIIKHYIDSMSILPFLNNQEIKVIDIGSGAGFPGIPIKVVYKKVDVTLLDSLEKRIKFLDEVIKGLELHGIRALHGRAEEYGIKQEFRGKYDVAIARAVASLPVLLEYSLPFVKIGGIFIAMKGSNTEEISTSKKALGILGGEIIEIKELTLPCSDMKRNIIIIKKLRQTPTKYPRIAGKPSKEPLI